MKILNDVNNIPFKTLVFAKEELNEILNNRNNFNMYETTSTVRYMLELIKHSSLATEQELNEKNIKLINDYFGVNSCEENNYKCLKDVVEYINNKIRVHNFYEMMKD